MRSVWIRCDAASAADMLVTVEPVDEGQSFAMVAGTTREINVGDERSITSIIVQGSGGTATYSFWPTG
jgi:hypothetical protein